MNSRALGGVAIAIILVACGCSRTYVPRQQNINLDKLPKMNSRESALSSSAFVSAGETSHTSALMRWKDPPRAYLRSASEATLTGSVIEHVETELEKRGVRIDPSAATRFTIAITNPRLQREFSTGIRCYVDVLVHTGDGEQFEFEATKNGFSISHCWDGVLAHAAIAVLETDGLLEYLSQTAVHGNGTSP